MKDFTMKIMWRIKKNISALEISRDSPYLFFHCLYLTCNVKWFYVYYKAVCQSKRQKGQTHVCWSVRRKKELKIAMFWWWTYSEMTSGGKPRGMGELLEHSAVSLVHVQLAGHRVVRLLPSATSSTSETTQNKQKLRAPTSSMLTRQPASDPRARYQRSWNGESLGRGN